MRMQRHECPRYHGMMVEDYSELLSPSDRGEDVFIWHRVNCGEYIDWLVLLNRWAQQRMSPFPFQLVRGEPAPPRSSLRSSRRHATL